MTQNWRPNRQTVKNSNFENLRWRTAAILKTVKSPHLRSRRTDFDEIWQGNTYRPLYSGLTVKFFFLEFLKIQDGAGHHRE